MADNGHKNFASKTERLLAPDALDVKLEDSVKSLFIYGQNKSATKDLFFIYMSDLHSL